MFEVSVNLKSIYVCVYIYIYQQSVIPQCISHKLIIQDQITRSFICYLARFIRNKINSIFFYVC